MRACIKITTGVTKLEEEKQSVSACLYCISAFKVTHVLQSDETQTSLHFELP